MSQLDRIEALLLEIRAAVMPGEAPEDAPGATNVPAKDTGAQKRGDRPSADAGGPVAPVSRRKHATLCPEDLTPKQRAQVRKWRDTKHPEIDDFILKTQWERHAAYYGARREMRPDWVRSFYGWLLKHKEFQQAAPSSEPARQQSPAFAPSGKPPAAMTEDEKDAMHEEHLKDKREAGFRPLAGPGALKERDDGKKEG